MNLYRLSVLALGLCLVAACSTTSESNVKIQNKESDELLEFAKVNCMFWYFKKKDYELGDIRAISGGIVEMGSYSAETYQKVAQLTKAYSPKLHSKHNIDVDLWKCFKLESDNEFIRQLNRLK